MTSVRLVGYNDLEAVYDDPERVGRLAGLVAELRDERTVVCGAGDNTALGVVPLVSGEKRAFARPLFERLQPDAETFGNHDFDLGREPALSWADSVPPTYCCVNYEGPGADRVPDATVVERAGQRIGIVGVAHPETATVCGSITEPSFTDPVASVERAAASLETDRLVVCAHCGEHDRRIARETEADAVFGGHRHSRLCETVGDTALVRTGGGGNAVAVVELGESPQPRIRETSEAPVDAELAATYRERREAAGVDRRITELTEPIERTEAERFGGESRAGNFLAEAIRASADASVALFPAGSLREGARLEGTITAADVVSLAPFGDTVREVAVDGARLRAVLDGAAAPHPGDRGWVHAHVAGCRVRWNADGSLRAVSHDGAPIDDDASYRVATTGWVLATGAPFTELTPELVVADHEQIYEAALAHARDGGLKRAACDGRLRRVE